MVVFKVFENSYDDQTNSKEFAHPKKHDYYFNKFLNWLFFYRILRHKTVFYAYIPHFWCKIALYGDSSAPLYAIS